MEICYQNKTQQESTPFDLRSPQVQFLTLPGRNELILHENQESLQISGDYTGLAQGRFLCFSANRLSIFEFCIKCKAAKNKLVAYLLV